jgi:hypothetical protein
MDVICVATTDGRAYYSILTRLRRTGLPFRSLTPELVDSRCALTLTTRGELGSIEGVTVAIEDLGEDPVIMKGQLLAILQKGSKRELLIGIDPGSRVGVAIFYQNVKLASLTFRSTGALLVMLEGVVQNIPYSKLVVRVGGGAPKHSKSLARAIRRRVNTAAIEIVDEKGTSSNRLRKKGLTKDQLAAARIAYRKGLAFLK